MGVWLDRIRTPRGRVLFAIVLALGVFGLSLLEGRRQRSTLVLAAASDSGGGALAGLDLGSLGPLAGGLSLPGGDGLTQLRRVQRLVSSEEAFDELLDAGPALAEALELGSTSTAEDSAGAYLRFRREFVSTSLDKQAQTLDIHLLGDRLPMVREMADALSTIVVDHLSELRRERSHQRRAGIEELRTEAEASLKAHEDSLVSLLEGSSLALGSPRVQQRIASVERKAMLWGQVLQAMSAEEIRLSSSARSDVPDVFVILGPSRFDERSGISPMRALLFSIIAGLVAWISIGLLPRAEGSAEA